MRVDGFVVYFILHLKASEKIRGAWNQNCNASDNPPCPKRGTSAAPAGVEGSVFEPPFPIPESWAWTKLGEIGDTNIGLTYHPQDISDNGIPVLRSNNIQNGNLVLSSLVRVACHILPSQFIKNGDVLICARNGSKALVGKSVLVDSLVEPTSFGAFMAVFRSQFNPFIQLFLQSDEFKQYLNKSNSTTIHQLTQSMLKDAWMPFPSFPEQQRIVKRFEALSALCDAIDIQSVSLSVLAEQAKQKVLDLAIRGLLVSQNPADEPASVLLDRIRSTADKPPCPKKGKKREATIGDVLDPPFLIPESWAWTTLGDVAELVLGGTPDTHDSKCWGGDIPWLTPGEMSDIKGKYVSDTRRKLTRTGLEKASRMFPSRSVILSTRAPIGYLFINTVPMCTNQGCKTIVPKCGVLAEYLYYNLLGRVPELQSLGTGTTFKELSSGKLASLPLSLPPLAEQRRIVAKVDELFATIDGMLG